MRVLHVMEATIGGTRRHLVDVARGQHQAGLEVHLAWCGIVHSHLLKADAVTAVAATLWGRRKRLVSSKHNDERALQNPGCARAHRWLGNLPPLTIVLSDHVGRYFERLGGLHADRLRRIYYGLDPEPFEHAVSNAVSNASDSDNASADASADTSAGTSDARTALRTEVRGELDLAADDVVAICVARFAPQKAHGVLLEAFWRARRRGIAYVRAAPARP